MADGCWAGGGGGGRGGGRGVSGKAGCVWGGGAGEGGRGGAESLRGRSSSAALSRFHSSKLTNGSSGGRGGEGGSAGHVGYLNAAQGSVAAAGGRARARARRRGRVSIRMSGGDSGHTGILVINNTAPDMAAP